MDMSVELGQEREIDWIKKVPEHLKPLLNNLIGNLKSFHKSLCKKGLYLPALKSRAIHGEYLWKVFTK